LSDPDADRWNRLWELFDAARELPAGADRDAFVAAGCAGDEELAAELAELLAAGDGDASLLDRGGRAWVERMFDQPDPPAAAGAAESPSATGARATAEPWTLGRLLGEGGMGRVYEGERRGEGFVQRAAVKLLSAGAPHGPLHQRFLAERGILARLEHPGIARMLDAGVAADGLPYLAMELVEGETLTDACRSRRATVEQRIALFLEVCAAVEHAHRNLVVHRDLKPSNVMVDRDGRVKLLDFGIAKLLEPDENAAAQPTLLRALTPRYAAPEQITGAAVTTATDVYALGVLLFELLAGRLPFDSAAASPFTLEQEIVRGAPARLAEAARPDPTRPEGARLSRRLAGDLERIVQRAMAKEPARRYPSVDAFAADLRRHLEGRPVEARGDSLGYRVDKFVRRHRVAVALTALGALALVAALVTALAQARRAEREASRARAEAELAATSRDFLVSLFASADPNQAQGRVMTDREMLATGVARIDRELANRPELQLPLLAQIASVYLQLGDYDLAEPLARRVLAAELARNGEAALETARARRELAEIRYQRNAFEEAIALDRAAGPRLAESPEAADRQGAIESRVNLAKASFALGRQAEAAAEMERAERAAREQFGPESPQLFRVLTARTSLLLNAARHAEGAVAAREAAALARRLHGPDAPPTLSAELNEVVAASNLGRRDEARRLLEGLPERLTRVLGPLHGESLLAVRLDARLRSADGEFEAALTALERVAAALRSADQPQTLGYTLVQAANVAAAAGENARAAALAREAVRVFERLFGARHVDTAFARSALGQALALGGDLASAGRELERAASDEVEAGTGASDFHADTLERLGDLRLREGRRGEARRLLEQALAIRRANSPDGSRATGTTLALLAASLDGSERVARCRELLGEAVALLGRALGPDHPERRAAEQALAACPAS